MTSISKTDKEWKAVLSPEQVDISFRVYSTAHSYNIFYSSEFYAKRAQKHPEPASTISTTLKGSILVLDAERLCTKVLPSSMSVFLLVI
jgi:hypothetical protein